MEYQATNPTNIHGLQPSFKVYDSTDVEKRGEQPLYGVVQHCMEHLETVKQNINTLGDDKLAELELITKKIENWSLAKIKYYDESWKGFLKRIFSCCRNAWSFGVFRSSGEQGLFIAAILREEIRKRREADNLEPAERLRLEVEKILKNAELQIVNLYQGQDFNKDESISEEAEINEEIEIKPSKSTQNTKQEKPSPYSADNSPFKGKQQTDNRNIHIRPQSSPTKDSVRKQFHFKSESTGELSNALKNDSQASPKPRSFSVSDAETPPPKIYVPDSPSWQLNRKKKLEATQIPDTFPSVLDEVLFRVEHKIYGEPGQIYTLLDTLLKNGKLEEFLEKLGSEELLDAYWECESSEFITCETNRLSRIERLKIIFRCLSDKQFERSITRSTFFTLIGSSTPMHYAKVAGDVFSAKQLEDIASNCDSAIRLNQLSQILFDLDSEEEVVDIRFEKRITEGWEPSKLRIMLREEVYNERYTKLVAIVTGIGKINIVVKINKDCSMYLNNIKTLIGKKAPGKTGNELLAKLKIEMGR